MKKIFVFLAVILLAFSLPLTSFASGSRVNDTADLLTDEEEAKLITYTDEIYRTYGVDVVLVLEDTYVSSPQYYAESYYDNGGYSKDGIIFYLSVYDRDWYMATSGSCIQTLSDSRLDDIFEEIRYDLAEDEFYDAMSSFVILCDEYLAEGPAFSDTFLGGYLLRLLVVIPVAFVIALIVVSMEKKKMKTAVLQKNANEYIIHGSVDVNQSKDVFVTSTTTRVPISSGNGGRSGGGGGVSHGGRGGKF